MGIYDPVLQAYQHGVDQQIDLASRPMTLAQSILQGYQQGFGNRMQREHLGLQRDQLAEQMRRAQAQEAEARMWHQGQTQDKLLRQYQDDIIASPEQAQSMRTLLTKNGLDPSVAAGLVKDPQKDPYAKGSVDFGTGELPVEPLQPGTQGYEGEYIPQMGGKALLKSRGLDIKQQGADWRQQYQSRQLDQKDIEELRKARVDENRIQQIQEAIRMGRSLEPFTQELKAAQAWRARNYLPESTGFGAGGQMNTKTMAEIMRRAQQIKAASDKEAQAYNDSLAGIKDSQKGVAPKAGLSEDEALQKALEQVRTVSEAGSTPGSGFTVSGGGVSLVPTKPGAAPAPKPSGSGSIKLKIKASKPIAKDGSGKEVWKVGGKFYYGDGTEYQPPAQ